MSDLIDLLLAESELPNDRELRDLLNEIEREATAVRPMPSAALSTLLRSRTTARPRSLAGRGAIITGVVVIGVLGLGAGAAAASPDVRSAIGAGVAAIAHLFDPAAAAAPRGQMGEVTPLPAVSSSAEPSIPATPVPSESPSTSVTPPSEAPSPSTTPSPSDGSTSGNGNGNGNSNSGNGNGNGNQSGHGNGKGNQSGHGNGKGRGNGGPAPTP